jgi:hypothetical protein
MACYRDSFNFYLYKICFKMLFSKPSGRLPEMKRLSLKVSESGI